MSNLVPRRDRQDRQFAGLVASYDHAHAELVISRKIKREAIQTQAELTDYAMGAVSALGERQRLYTELAPHAAGLIHHIAVSGGLNIARIQNLGGDW